MNRGGRIQVLFIAGFGPIVKDRAESQRLYEEAPGIRFKEEEGGYSHTGELDGAKRFSLWPLDMATQSRFGEDEWPKDIAAPQARLEFEAENVERATADRESSGRRMSIQNKKEPWRQTVTGFPSLEGILAGSTLTAWMREQKSSEDPQENN
jgi:hypothetical protein